MSGGLLVAKGDKGDAYVITEADKQEIKEALSGDINELKGDLNELDYRLSESITDISKSIGFDNGVVKPTFTTVDGKYINPAGNESSSETIKRTSIIDIKGSEYISVNYTRSNPYIGIIAFYKENVALTSYYASTVLSSVTDNEKIPVPSDANFVVVSYITDDFVGKSLELTVYSSPKSDVEDIKKTLDDMNLTEIEHPTITWTDGKYVGPNDGNFGNNEAMSLSNAINIDGSNSVSVNFTQAKTQYTAPIAFYVEDPNNINPPAAWFISADSCEENKSIAIPKNAKYMVISRETTLKETVVVTIEKSVFHNIDEKISKINGSESIGVFFGDSIMQGVGVLPTNGTVPMLNASHVAESIMGSKIYNCGIGGTSLTRGSSANFCEIVDAITGLTDWSAIDTEVNRIINNNVSFGGLRTTIEEVKALDFNTVDFVLIAYGTNDWAFNRPLGSDESTNEGEVVGAYKYAINKLLSTYPHLKVYIVAPAYRWDRTTGIDSDTETHDGKNLREYANGIEHCAELLNIPCKNLYKDGMVNKFNRTEFLSDGVHRNIKGYKLLGEQYAKFIMSN